jgi:hypothetical protein
MGVCAPPHERSSCSNLLLVPQVYRRARLGTPLYHVRGLCSEQLRLQEKDGYKSWLRRATSCAGKRAGFKASSHQHQNTSQTFCRCDPLYFTVRLGFNSIACCVAALASLHQPSRCFYELASKPRQVELHLRVRVRRRLTASQVRHADCVRHEPHSFEHTPTSEYNIMPWTPSI